MDTDSNHVRLGALGIVALSLFLALFARLWFLQGIERQTFEAASVSNRLRVISTEGPRGRILDRNGKVIVDNRTSIVVSLDREPLRHLVAGLDERIPGDLAKMKAGLEPEFTRTAAALTSLGLPTTAEEIWTKFQDKRYSPQEPVPVAEDVGTDVEQYLLERAAEFPGVIVERRTVRSYPYGTLAAHLVGYVGEINDKELAAHGDANGGATSSTSTTTSTPAKGDEAKPYQLSDAIGKTGVEQAYEDDLRAVPGQRTIEVNAKGEMLDVVSDTPPRPGDDVWLSVDIDLQARAEQQLTAKLKSLRGGAGGARQGSVVITDPITGEVLAMASFPTYDPARLVNGIPTQLWNQLNDPASGLPLNNWAMQGTYAPGSTFKPVTAIAAWRTGFLAPGKDTYVDRGVFKLQGCKGKQCEYRNAQGRVYGSVDLSRALTVSSDAYFYRIGEGLWLNRALTGDTPIQDVAGEFGLGSRSGIEITGEAAGRIPTPAARKAAYQASPDKFVTGDWFTGDNVITAIGQGDVLVTPLQLADLYATLANGGTLMRPHVVHQVTRPKDPTVAPGAADNFEVVRTIEPAARGKVDIHPDEYQKIIGGLIGVTQDPSGTAYSAFKESRTAWPMAGKTGTAEVKGKVDTSVFAAWGPAVATERPRYTIAVMIPEAGFGGDVAAPLALRILAPMSDGTLPEACPVIEPEASACAARNAAKFPTGEPPHPPPPSYADSYGGGN